MYLHIKFDGLEIIVTRPGTNMMTAYRKAPDRPNLMLTRSWENPTLMSPEISEFRAHAFLSESNDLSALPHAVRGEPCVTRFTTIAAMPASTALACGDDSMSMIGFDPGACP